MVTVPRDAAEPAPDDATLASPPQQPLSRYLSPRYWPAWVLIGWLRLTAALPWRSAITLHRWLGRGLWYCLRTRRRIVVRNLALCFPRLSRTEVDTLGRRYFENYGAMLAEIATAWFATSARAHPPVRVEGREHLDAALAAGRGVILYSGHFTPLELCVQFVGALTASFAFMYRRRSNALLDACQSRGRTRTAPSSLANTDVRGMLRLLACNTAIWYAPDQAHRGSGAELLPFFGEPAMTNTATARLARLSGARVVPMAFRRLADGAGYTLRFEPALESFPSGDDRVDTLRLVAILERFIDECRDQYLWTHRRFKGRGHGLPDAYAASSPTSAKAVGWRAWLAAPALIGTVALFITAVHNSPLWSTAARVTLQDDHRFAILWSLFVIVFSTLAFALALIPGRRLLKAAAAALLLVAAACNFYMREYGIVIDESMIRNAVETTLLEATPLVSGAFLSYLAVFGLLPAALVAWVPLPRQGLRRAMLGRLAVAVASSGLLLGSLYANYGALSFFGHQHHRLRLAMNPGYPLYATARFLIGHEDTPAARIPLAAELRGDALATHKPALVVLVMGETARADRFSLNGYARDTNRYTRPHSVVNFSDVRSCGTSTAESLPCLFSPLGQAGFTHAAAAAHESWLGTLARFGIEVFWRDNSTGCKGACDPRQFAQYADETDADFCDATGCFDEILLRDFDALLDDASHDHLIVLHQRGSHGPAYHTDAPSWIKEYGPECDLPNLRNCSRETINNAYDNTILYTDYFVSRVIETLEAHGDRFATAMLYVSDHGESLGENGLYLHGFPYALAPEEQKRVPMLFWASAEFYRERVGAPRDCLGTTADRPTSHDALLHTLLPLFRVDARSYDATLDLFADCRKSTAPVTRMQTRPQPYAAAPPAG